MSEPFVGQIATFAFNYAPRGWAFCAGQLLPINQYSAVFALLGITYGGNGTVNFALPDLRGRSMIGATLGGGGPSPLPPYELGEVGGAATVQISSLLGEHSHLATVSGLVAGAQNVPVTVGVTGATVNVTGSPLASKGSATSDAPIAGGMFADVSPNNVKVYGSASTNTATLAPISATGTFSANATGTIPQLTLPVSGTVTVTVQPAGSAAGTTVPTQSPFLAMNTAIALLGLFPSRP
jgi:microcystin-dependent protein